ncbi:saccharopine dehydrogenase NADP-binding domain-containing protein [uncultured Pseudokineococcus sp.]|uniref:saccharopine dehydrogenase NADP-binding domain-containing protein n=1 Tax=uncultured Pseudokineococcus sp. TaxID=1642928 RepID=UPI0026187CEC|nr:saccharopine dehydrogenase NADP-binding domain-containing protein [uncultured Pseudokineococcus sp.]
MSDGASPRDGASDGVRDLDVLVLGATGFTGRLVAQQLAERAALTGVRWAVAGRSPDKLAMLLTQLGVPHVPSVVVDLQDGAALERAARRTRVLLDLAGPYSTTADAVIEACVRGGASYVDLSGEIPAVARSVRAWHEPARRAGVRVVQVSGYEALPADLAVLVACSRAARTDASAASDGTAGALGDGPGAGGPVVAVSVTTTARPPRRRMGLSDAVSGGTLQSIAEVLADDDARAAGDPAALVPDERAARRVRRTSPLSLRPRVVRGRVLGPLVPAGFIDPPVLHRTAALLAAERGVPHSPAALAEGMDIGPARLPVGALALLAATASAALQRAVLGLTRLPSPVRARVASALARVLPGSGTGPRGEVLDGWTWSVRADALTRSGARASAVLDGVGHPGYRATARMVAEVGLLLAASADDPPRTGHLTPALAVGLEGLPALAAAGLVLRED